MKNVKIKVGNNHTLSKLLEQFRNIGYEYVNGGSVRSGQFSRTGDQIKVWPVNFLYSVNIDFFGNNIEKIYHQENNKKVELGDVEIFKNCFLLDDGTNICAGDYVVHDDCGIGIFNSIETIKIENEDIQYINIGYLNDNLLRVPSNLTSKITQYIGVGKKKPKLSRLGSTSWKKTYQKVYENIWLVARELLKIYASREICDRTPYKIDESWNAEIKKTFLYTETGDQERAITDVLSDMQKKQPMDRLICGDVGFGKTEIAIRALVQAVANGRQVAILVPTTILAEQHFVNIKNRLNKMPVSINHLSRFVGPSEQAEILSQLSCGTLDVIVGTHKLLSQSIKYKDLGLLIIDEEQKFGVKQKEKIKLLKENIDVLTMTATPIPRTLFMSLSGVRDISQINNPPHGRKSIVTKIDIYNEKIICGYISKEIKRGGQVYYLHNEVSTIVSAKKKIEKLVPGARVGVGHGQMGEAELSRAMIDFANGDTDVLVCSTIIENGLDLPNVNTIIVEGADKFGLSQMYQIRGRVGRSDREAYALFLHKKIITDNAIKRLRSLADNSELGSGYNIALSDLEIRGGGNILGREQHGNMEAIGLVLYSRLLKQMVNLLKGSDKEEGIEREKQIFTSTERSS